MAFVGPPAFRARIIGMKKAGQEAGQEALPTRSALHGAVKKL
jgi:hypothetical protein